MESAWLRNVSPDSTACRLRSNSPAAPGAERVSGGWTQLLCAHPAKTFVTSV
ncbi:hypothetical protein [Streptomyces sp. NPDC058745]|uniref:hypothetical protein n=1 Tax=Streptomyces sp. NPDC058745 TaxID=3346621 RepID=UPI0036AE0752